MEGTNDWNHFGLGALGVLEFVDSENKFGMEDNGRSRGRGEVEWGGRLWWIGEERFKRLSQLIILELI